MYITIHTKQFNSCISSNSKQLVKAPRYPIVYKFRNLTLDKLTIQAYQTIDILHLNS